MIHTVATSCQCGPLNQSIKESGQYSWLTYDQSIGQISLWPGAGALSGVYTLTMQSNGLEFTFQVTLVEQPEDPVVANPQIVHSPDQVEET